MEIDILVKIGSGKDFLPVRPQVIDWTNGDLLSIKSQGTYFNDILFEIQKFALKKMYLKVSSKNC